MEELDGGGGGGSPGGSGGGGGGGGASGSGGAFFICSMQKHLTALSLLEGRRPAKTAACEIWSLQ